MNEKAVLDVVERAGMTFLMAFGAVLAVSDLSSWDSIKVSLVAAATSALKSTIVNLVKK